MVENIKCEFAAKWGSRKLYGDSKHCRHEGGDD